MASKTFYKEQFYVLDIQILAYVCATRRLPCAIERGMTWVTNTFVDPQRLPHYVVTKMGQSRAPVGSTEKHQCNDREGMQIIKAKRSEAKRRRG